MIKSITLPDAVGSALEDRARLCGISTEKLALSIIEAALLSRPAENALPDDGADKRVEAAIALARAKLKIVTLIRQQMDLEKQRHVVEHSRIELLRLRSGCLTPDDPQIITEYDETGQRLDSELRTIERSLIKSKSRSKALVRVLTQVERVYQDLHENAEWITLVATVQHLIDLEKQLVAIKAAPHCDTKPPDWPGLLDVINRLSRDAEVAEQVADPTESTPGK